MSEITVTVCSIPPPQRAIQNSEEEGVGGSDHKKPSVGGVWIFSGTTHYMEIQC